MKIIKNELKLKFLGYGVYELLEDVHYINNLTVPKGFKTDLASIPKIFQPIIGEPYDAEYRHASILHDYLYSKYSIYPINRHTADKIFFQLIRLSGCKFVKARAMFKAVRLGGGLHWEKKIYIEEPYNEVALIDHTKEHKSYQNKLKDLLKEWYV